MRRPWADRVSALVGEAERNGEGGSDPEPPTELPADGPG